MIDSSHGVNQFKEVELNTGLGHGIVFRPLKEWIEPTKDWGKLNLVPMTNYYATQSFVETLPVI